MSYPSFVPSEPYLQAKQTKPTHSPTAKKNQYQQESKGQKKRKKKMCFYQPNKQPCTCSFLNLVRPCSQAEFYPSLAPLPSAIPLASSPSSSGSDGIGVLIKPCPDRCITYEAGERYCLKCCRTRSRMGMRMEMVDLSGEEDGSGFGDMDMIPLDSPEQDSSGSGGDDGSGGEILPIPPPHSPPPTLHTTRPNRFKRQPVSSPVMHLRMKWKKSLIRSVRASAAEAAAEEARAAKAKAAKVEAEAEAAKTASIPDYMNMAMAMAMDDSKSVLAGCEVMGLGITVDENGGLCLSDIPPFPPVGKVFSGLGGRSVNGSYRGVEFSTRVNGFS